jgi:hypothetical protein
MNPNIFPQTSDTSNSNSYGGGGEKEITKLWILHSHQELQHIHDPSYTTKCTVHTNFLIKDLTHTSPPDFVEGNVNAFCPFLTWT